MFPAAGSSAAPLLSRCHTPAVCSCPDPAGTQTLTQLKDAPGRGTSVLEGQKCSVCPCLSVPAFPLTAWSSKPAFGWWQMLDLEDLAPDKRCCRCGRKGIASFPHCIRLAQGQPGQFGAALSQPSHRLVTPLVPHNG